MSFCEWTCYVTLHSQMCLWHRRRHIQLPHQSRKLGLASTRTLRCLTSSASRQRPAVPQAEMALEKCTVLGCTPGWWAFMAANTCTPEPVSPVTTGAWGGKGGDF